MLSFQKTRFSRRKTVLKKKKKKKKKKKTRYNFQL